MAPFAFLGTPESYAEVVDLYENPGRDWVRKRGVIPYLPGNVSLFEVSGLHAKIRSVVTPEMIRSIGEEASKNRLLLIGAANIDYGMLRVWDLAWLASTSTPEEARERAITILQASSAIPGAFPPIAMDDHLYVDGGAAMQLIGGIEERAWIHAGELEIDYLEPDRPIRLRIWMIVNQKLLPDPLVVRSRWTSVGARSLDTLIRTSTLQSIQDAALTAKAIDAMPEFEAEFRYVAIPQDFPTSDTSDMVNPELMRALVELGREMGADPASWRTEPLRPGAPFKLKR